MAFYILFKKKRVHLIIARNSYTLFLKCLVFQNDPKIIIKKKTFIKIGPIYMYIRNCVKYI